MEVKAKLGEWKRGIPHPQFFVSVADKRVGRIHGGAKAGFE